MTTKTSYMNTQDNKSRITDKIIKDFFNHEGIPQGLLHSTELIKSWEDFKASLAVSEGEEKKDWEILSFKKGEDIIELRDGKYRNNLNSISLENCFSLGLPIHSVKHLSDGEVFTVGDKIGWGMSNFETHILSFQINKQREGRLEIGYRYRDKYSDSFVDFLDALLLHRKEPERKPLFTTDDGKEIFEGDTYWCLQSEWFVAECDSSHYDPARKIKRFSTKAAANEYVLMNKPCLSLNDIESCQTRNNWGGYVFGFLDEDKLKELAQSKIKGGK